MRKERLVELELFRAFAFLFVLIQHTIGGYSIDPKAPLDNVILLRFIYTISKAAVPMFVFISAVSLFYTYNNKMKLKEYYKKRLLTIVLPYLCCTILYIIKFNIKPENIFISILDGNTVFHLWYMAMIIRLYLIFPIILILLTKLTKRTKLFNMNFILIFTILSYLLIYFKDDIKDFFSSLPTGNSIFFIKEFIDRSPVFWAVYFVAGYYFITYYKEVNAVILKYKAALIVSYVILFSSNYVIRMGEGNVLHFHFNSILAKALEISYYLCSFFIWYYISICITQFKSKLFSCLNFISHYSYGGYLLHVMIIQHIAGLFYSHYKLSNNYIFPSLFLFISSAILIPIVCYFLSFIPYSKYIFGCTKYRIKTAL